MSARNLLDLVIASAVVRALMVQTTPAEVGAKARAIALDRGTSVAPADRVAPVAEDAALNEMTLVQNVEGRFGATLDLDVTTGEELCAALDPL
ncbi:HNH endonuclease, partial [Mycolicibacterium sp. A43C]